MKTSHSSLLTRLTPFTLAAVALLGAATTSRAAAILSFSGGNNTPFVFNLLSPVQFTLNATATGSGPFFVFKAVGNVLGAQTGDTGSVAYSINGGPNVSITTENSGAAIGTIAANDLFIFGTASTLTVGNVVTLSAGSLTTTSNVAGAPPANGSYTVIITDGNGVPISTAGVSVPEPGAWALGGAGIAVLCGSCRRSRRAAVVC